MKFKVIVYKNYGPYVFEFNTYRQAIDEIKHHWFSSGVWDIRLFANNEELDISEIVRSWGNRPIYS